MKENLIFFFICTALALISSFFTIEINQFKKQYHAPQELVFLKALKAHRWKCQSDDQIVLLNLQGLSSFSPNEGTKETKSIGQKSVEWIDKKLNNQRLIIKNPTKKLGSDTGIHSTTVLLNEENIGLKIVEMGFCVVKENSNFEEKKTYIAKEKIAKEKKLGIWGTSTLQGAITLKLN